MVRGMLQYMYVLHSCVVNQSNKAGHYIFHTCISIKMADQNIEQDTFKHTCTIILCTQYAVSCVLCVQCTEPRPKAPCGNKRLPQWAGGSRASEGLGQQQRQ